MGKKNRQQSGSSPKVPLLDSEEWLSAQLLRALQTVFQRFDADGDGALNEAELQAFARACNGGTELDADELDQADLEHKVLAFNPEVPVHVCELACMRACTSACACVHACNTRAVGSPVVQHRRTAALLLLTAAQLDGSNFGKQEGEQEIRDQGCVVAPP